jgi:hypothetical protein
MNNKIDDLLDVRREQQIDVLFLTETWHDSDSVSIRRLRADGFQVIERARPRRLGANPLFTNHGGVAAVAVPGVRLTKLELGIKSSSSEQLKLGENPLLSSFCAAASRPARLPASW